MLIKTGDCQIIEVIKDKEHHIDDVGTKKALEKTKKMVEKELGSEEQSAKNDN
jgi:hypothetical protein